MKYHSLRIEDVHLKAKLSSCITNSNRLACDRFQFIPNEICDYEAFNSYGAEHSKEMKLNAMFKILESGSYSTRARCTDNTDSGCKRKDIETNDHSLIRPEEEGDRSHDTSSGMWLSTVIVKYDGGSDCLACLLLLHEVLLVSLSNSNVCMIEKKEGLECACKTTLKEAFQPLKIHSLQQIRMADMKHLLHLHKVTKWHIQRAAHWNLLFTIRGDDLRLLINKPPSSFFRLLYMRQGCLQIIQMLLD
uniref:AlNc14C261G9823 protein n=1 Tax=Albugo laibachii Nc14 TaxID=890382 RepID=F0WCN6_9STRA|nr:AlNc14C60G4418 [Albugo laibachii Nc14]CCA24844.1 AlNc14C261G9823 [Albugo laibachii Nc14]|eukprot:CCA24844.1 AlNc14C261G9823 [Albugo laibachii Nc14]